MEKKKMRSAGGKEIETHIHLPRRSCEKGGWELRNFVYFDGQQDFFAYHTFNMVPWLPSSGLIALYSLILLFMGLELYPVGNSWAQTLASCRCSLQKRCLPHDVHFQPLAHSSINWFPPYQATGGIPTRSAFRELPQRCLTSLECKGGNAI